MNFGSLLQTKTRNIYSLKSFKFKSRWNLMAAAFPQSKDILPSRAGIASRTSTTMQQNVIKTKIILKKKNFCQDIVLVSGLALSVALALFCCESGLLCRIEVEGLSKIYLRWIATTPVLRTVSDQKYSFINQKVSNFGSNCYNIESDWKIGFNPNASKLLLIYFTTDNIFSTQKWQFSSLYSANISLEGYK